MIISFHLQPHLWVLLQVRKCQSSVHFFWQKAEFEFSTFYGLFLLFFFVCFFCDWKHQRAVDGYKNVFCCAMSSPLKQCFLWLIPLSAMNHIFSKELFYYANHSRGYQDIIIITATLKCSMSLYHLLKASPPPTRVKIRGGFFLKRSFSWTMV